MNDTARAGEPEPGGSAEPAEALAALVSKLRAELTGVRTAMRNRAVIEQAKGVLVERLGVNPDEGFDQLVRLSQRTNIKLIEIAAAIVGTTAPDPNAPDVASLIDDELREHVAKTRQREVRKGEPETPAAVQQARKRGVRPPEVEALQAQHQLLSGRISAARSYDEIAEALSTTTAGWPAPSSAAITLLDPDGAQRLVGVQGIRGELRSQWSRVPPVPALPLVVTVRDLEVIWLSSPAAVAERFPLLRELPFDGASVFAAPLVSHGRVLGALMLSWSEVLADGEEIRRYLGALVGPVARRVDELVGEQIANAWVDELAGDVMGSSGGAPAQVWLPTVIDALHNPATLLSPVIEDGQVVDFHVEYPNALARRLMAAARVDPDDTTLLAVYPVLGSTTLLPEFAHLLQDGQPRRLSGLRGDAPGGDDARTGSGRRGDQSSTVDLHAVRLWDRVFAVWRVHSDAERLHDQFLAAERIARIGSFCWDLRTHEPQYSPELVRLFHGDAEPPRPDTVIRLDELTRAVHQDDLLAVQEAVHRTIVEGKHLLAEFRGASRLAGRRLRVAAEPVLEAGTVVMVRGTVQDVTEERAIEARLRMAEEALAAQRRRMADERRAAEALQQALLPTEPELGDTVGLAICGRCRSVAKVGTVDGDWFDATPLADGSTLLVLGDVDDSGLSSMTTAARLRYAIRAYAELDMAPADVLTALNSMMWAMASEHTAMLVVARFTPGNRQLRWAAAGQMTPVRYAPDDSGSILSGPLGLPLGTAPDVRYSDTTVDLSVGDRLLFYTDGLVRTDRRRSGGLDVLRRAGQHVDLGDLEAIVTHITEALGANDDEDMCALLVRVD